MKIYGFPRMPRCSARESIRSIARTYELPLMANPGGVLPFVVEQTTSWESILLRLVTETMAKSCKLFGGMFASFECSVFVELEKESCRARCRTHR